VAELALFPSDDVLSSDAFSVEIAYRECAPPDLFEAQLAFLPLPDVGFKVPDLAVDLLQRSDLFLDVRGVPEGFKFCLETRALLDQRFILGKALFFQEQDAIAVDHLVQWHFHIYVLTTMH